MIDQFTYLHQLEAERTMHDFERARDRAARWEPAPCPTDWRPDDRRTHHP